MSGVIHDQSPRLKAAGVELLRVLEKNDWIYPNTDVEVLTAKGRDAALAAFELLSAELRSDLVRTISATDDWWQDDVQGVFTRVRDEIRAGGKFDIGDVHQDFIAGWLAVNGAKLASISVGRAALMGRVGKRRG